VQRALKLTLAQGHCYMGARQLEAAAARSLCCTQLPPERAAACVRLALDAMYKKGELPTPPMPNSTRSTARRFFLPSAYAAEEKIAIAVRRPSRSPNPNPNSNPHLTLTLTGTPTLLTRCAAARAVTTTRLRRRGRRRRGRRRRRRRRRRRTRRHAHCCRARSGRRCGVLTLTPGPLTPDP
jgi:hypothetical protein